MRTGVSFAVSCALLLGATSCSPDGASLLVVVLDGTGGRLVIPEDLDAFEIRVASAHPTDEAAADVVRYRRTFRLAHAGARGEGYVSLPQSLRIIEADDELATGLVRVDALGLRNGREIQRITRYRGFGDGRELELALTPLCFMVVCPDGQTCDVDGVCRGSTPECGLDSRCEEPPPPGPCGYDGVDCRGECVPSSETNCGTCAMACAPGERCISNRCACGAGFGLCGGVCVDLGADPRHCGGCDAACDTATSTSECREGRCQVIACAVGRADCNRDADDGCEIDVTTSLAHCGACGQPCDGGPSARTSCVSGTCRVDGCTSMSLANCDGRTDNGCETTLGTDAHCGGCTGCPRGTYCHGRSCAPDPSIRMILSDGMCGDEARTGTAWTMEVRGRPGAPAHIVADRTCLDTPVGPILDVTLDATGLYSTTGAGAGIMTMCAGDGPLAGRWTLTVEVDGRMDATQALFMNSLCPGYDECGDVVLLCP